MNLLLRAGGGLAGLLLTAGAVSAYHSSSTFQLGAPGVAMQVVETNERLGQRLAANAVPAPLPAADQTGELSVNAYRNVQVLGHLTAGDFTRTMTAMTQWVAPTQGCAYCHAAQRDAQGNVVKDDEGYPLADINKMWSDELYTKRVARRMLQMTQHINGNWKNHVKETGVTCYTCHRGQPVPQNIWFEQPEDPHEDGLVGANGGQNAPGTNNALASLPNGAFHPYFVGDENIRVIGTDALPSGNTQSIKQTEWTYGLMMHMANSLGVNCTYCHNTRAMADWDSSPPTRATAWYGIRMVRNLNNAFLLPLTPELPQQRLGVTGDGPKVNCATCHQGAYKPLLGVSMLKDYPALAEAKQQPLKTKGASMPVPGGDGDAGAGVMMTADGGTMAADGGPLSADGGATAGQSPAPTNALPDVAGQDAGGAPNPAITFDAGASKNKGADAGAATKAPKKP